MSLCIFRGSQCLSHDLGPAHPENPDRLYAIEDQLLASGVDLLCQHAEAPAISQQALARVHDAEYVQQLFERGQLKNGIDWLDEDTGLMAHTLQAARQAAGACCAAVDYVMAGPGRQGFCLVRPPGHHAEHGQAMGFCMFNNIVLAAQRAIDKYQLKRIAIVDFDVHHGNGTEQLVAGRPEVLLFSSFEHPLYPHSGCEPQADNIITAPLPAGADGDAFRAAVSPWLDKLEAFQPQLILISAGFDGHAEDPMAHLRLTEDDYKWISYELRQLADRHCQGRIVSSLEGGYDPSALGRSVVAHLKGLSGDGNETGGA